MYFLDSIHMIFYRHLTQLVFTGLRTAFLLLLIFKVPVRSSHEAPIAMALCRTGAPHFLQDTTISNLKDIEGKQQLRVVYAQDGDLLLIRSRSRLSENHIYIPDI